MSDKTCGTCRWFAQVPGDVSDGACLIYNDSGMYIDRGSSYDACDDGYEPRTDSIEQVIRELYTLLREFMEVMGAAEVEYADRLSKLGVEV